MPGWRVFTAYVYDLPMMLLLVRYAPIASWDVLCQLHFNFPSKQLSAQTHFLNAV
jgi:hypothetical protein